jgi:hypothetical protein
VLTQDEMEYIESDTKTGLMTQIMEEHFEIIEVPEKPQWRLRSQAPDGSSQWIAQLKFDGGHREIWFPTMEEALGFINAVRVAPVEEA